MTRWPDLFGRRHNPSLMPLDDALEALGDNGDMGWWTGEVPIANIVGSAGRATDFDHELRLVNKALGDRWNQLYRAMESGFEPPTVHLVQLGELYCIIDGHHRASAARALGRLVITARVHRICTIAYAKSCLRVAHLPTKAAERRFLERVPLLSEIRQELWLDEPAQWTRLADAAEAWGLRRSLERGRPLPRAELAATWWTEEVEPLVARLRAAGIGLDLRDIQLYVTALAVRDRLGAGSWPADIAEHLPTTMPRAKALRKQASTVTDRQPAGSRAG